MNVKTDFIDIVRLIQSERLKENVLFSDLSAVQIEFIEYCAHKRNTLIVNREIEGLINTQISITEEINEEANFQFFLHLLSDNLVHIGVLSEALSDKERKELFPYVFKQKSVQTGIFLY